jgi:hypothetical protein
MAPVDPGVHRTGPLPHGDRHWSYGAGFWAGIAGLTVALDTSPSGAHGAPRTDRLGEISRSRGRLRDVAGPEQRAARVARSGDAGPSTAARVVRDAARPGRTSSTSRYGPRPPTAAPTSAFTCGGGLEICDRANVYEAPAMPPNLSPLRRRATHR